MKVTRVRKYNGYESNTRAKVTMSFLKAASHSTIFHCTQLMVITNLSFYQKVNRVQQRHP